MEREAVTGYDWRKDAMTLVCFTTSQESHDALKRFIAHIERMEARDAKLTDLLATWVRCRDDVRNLRCPLYVMASIDGESGCSGGPDKSCAELLVEWAEEG